MDSANNTPWSAAALVPVTATVDGAPVAPRCRACGDHFARRGRAVRMVRTCGDVEDGLIVAEHPACWDMVYA